MGKLISDEQATDKVREIFDEIRSNFGMVPNFFRAQAAVNPDWLELNWIRWKNIMGHQGLLSRKMKELIAVVVSVINNCEYCSMAHEAMALMSGATKDEIEEVKKVVTLCASFNMIADSLRVPCDITPDTLSAKW